MAQLRRRIPEWFELYVGLEAAASHLRTYEPQIMPGLLQTRAYALEAHRAATPQARPAELERAVGLRLRRQKILTRKHPPAPQLAVVLDEAVLRRSADRRPVMAEQMDHLVAVSRLPNVSVRVLPFSAGRHRAERANGGFTILDFPPDRLGRQTEPPVVYSEGLTGALYLEKPHEIDAYANVWQDIEAGCLSEAQSRELFATLAEEWSA